MRRLSQRIAALLLGSSILAATAISPAIAEEIKLASPLAVQAMKRLAYANQTGTWHDVEELSKTLKKEVTRTEDAKEATRAFAEKRRPVWKLR